MLAETPLVRDTADTAGTKTETYSPTDPAFASLLVVVPFIPVSCPGVSKPVTPSVPLKVVFPVTPSVPPSVVFPVAPKVPDAVRFLAAKSWVDKPAKAAAPRVVRAAAAVASSSRV
jgi:hypothetical protein